MAKRSFRSAVAKLLLGNIQPGMRMIDTWGRTVSGTTITEDSAMRMAAVNACVRVLSEDVASLHLHVYRKTGKGRERAVDHPLYRLLHDVPNEEMTPFSFKQALMVNLLLTGNAYAFMEFDGAGRPAALWPLPSSMVTPFRDEKTRRIRYRVEGFRDVNAMEMFHVPGMAYDGLKGMSPIAYARESIGLGKAAEEFGGRFFGNGTHIGGVVEVPGALSDEGFERLSSEFAAQYKGLQNAHGVPVLESGAHFVQLGVSQKDAQFLDTRKFQRSEIASIFRVPPHMIGDLERATFSNIEHQSIEYLQRSLVPWLERIEQEANRKGLTPEERRTLYVEHDTANFLRGDTLSRMQAYSTAVMGGIMTPNECRQKENLNPKEGGDELLFPLNMTTSVEGNEGEDEGRSLMKAIKKGRRSRDFKPASRSAKDIETQFDVSGEAVEELREAVKAWLGAQADDIEKLISEERSRRSAEKRRKYSVQHLLDSLNTYYRQTAEDGPWSLEQAVERGEFPDWKDMTDALEGMTQTAWTAVKAELGDESGIDAEWMRGFMERYHRDMGSRLTNANLGELTRAIEGMEDGDEARNILEGILGRWHQSDKAASMAENEVAMCINEAKIAAYREAGYTSVWKSTAGCCKVCMQLNGKTVTTLKPPLHTGCHCTVQIAKNGGLTETGKGDIVNPNGKKKRPKTKKVHGFTVEIIYPDDIWHVDGFYKPYAVVDVVNKKGGISRYIYDRDGRIKGHIDNNDHGQPKWHVFKNGEHYHIAEWTEDGNFSFDDGNELSEYMREVNADILKKG